MKKESAAKKLGLRSLRYEFGLYPTVAQCQELIDQAAMVRALQNALIAIGENRYLRKISDPAARVPYLLRAGVLDDPSNHKLPRSAEMNRWITGLIDSDPRWRALSTHTPRRVCVAVDRSWAAFFRNLKANPALAGRPKRKRADDIWIPHIHNKRSGDIGSAGSGCRLIHIAHRNWHLQLKGIDGPIRARGQMPKGNQAFFDTLDCGRFIDADLKLVAGKWKLSICAHVKRERKSGRVNMRIEFNLIDGFARVNGQLMIPAGIVAAQGLQDHTDHLQSERDLRWPKRTPSDDAWRDANYEITHLRSKIARIRKNALQVWSTHVIAQAASIVIRAPRIRESTKSPRGDAKTWGAAVSTVSTLNRKVLSYAPGMAIAMLTYKAQEAGILCEVVEDNAPDIAVGRDLVAHSQLTRRVKRQLRKAA